MAGIRITLKETGQQSIARLWVHTPPESKKKEEPDYLIHFRRPEDYYGEFGFDWMRDDYSTICNNYEELKKEYYDCEKNEKVELLKDKEYFVPWFSMLPKQKDVKLALKLENIKRKLSRKDIIKIPTTESISFEPNEIKLKNIQKKEKEGKEFLVTVTCSKSLTKDICIPVLNKDNKEVGKLNVAKNDVEYHLPVTIINIEGNGIESRPISASEMEKIFNEKSFQQAFIKTSVKTDTLNKSIEELLSIGAISFLDESDNEDFKKAYNRTERIVANENTLEILEKIYAKPNKGVNLFILNVERIQFIKYIPNKPKTYGGYDIYEELEVNKNGNKTKVYKYICKYKTELDSNYKGKYFMLEGGRGGQSNVIPTKKNCCILYQGYDKRMTTVHEIGHLLGLSEIYKLLINEEIYNSNKQKTDPTEEEKDYIKDYEVMKKYKYFTFKHGSTDNFMDDYIRYNQVEIPKKSFYRWQWGVMQYEINNYIEK
ncbi:hypothetical protein C8P65_10558 [Capnocytophaga leadbetteri]|uniref:Uncharacterized protein n=1 Tax=Capnocytophaga leadbetteri TaxID=327575 RepID=A0A2T5XUT5_9FLAO|nr:hypothetical protein [Capnocytophaga leadbetteri]PTX07055.1 hypothetical protein C8P65_10558 [Capnocytophaga leadbetteri]